MATFRSPFVRKDATRGSRPLDGRLSLAGLLTPSSDLGALPGVISGLTVSGIASTWAYAVSAGHAVTKRSDADGANIPGLDGTTNTPTVAAAPGTGSRWDLIWIRQQDIDNADADSNSVIGVTQGTAGGTPTKPYASVPAGALVLAEAQVGTGATGTLHANVVITQVAAKVSTRGGIVPNPTTAQQALLNAVATATNPVWIDDAGVLRRSVGAGFVPGAWTAVPYSSGYGAYVVGGTTFTPPAVRIIGDEVEMSGGLVSYSSSASLVAGTTYAINTTAPLPSQYWPMDTHVASGAGGVHYGAALTPAEVRVTSAGLVQYVPFAAGSLTGTTSSWIVIPAMRWRLS